MSAAARAWPCRRRPTSSTPSSCMPCWRWPIRSGWRSACPARVSPRWAPSRTRWRPTWKTPTHTPRWPVGPLRPTTPTRRPTPAWPLGCWPRSWLWTGVRRSSPRRATPPPRRWAGRASTTSTWTPARSGSAPAWRTASTSGGWWTTPVKTTSPCGMFWAKRQKPQNRPRMWRTVLPRPSRRCRIPSPWSPLSPAAWPTTAAPSFPAGTIWPWRWWTSPTGRAGFQQLSSKARRMPGLTKPTSRPRKNTPGATSPPRKRRFPGASSGPPSPPPPAWAAPWATPGRPRSPLGWTITRSS